MMVRFKKPRLLVILIAVSLEAGAKDVRPPVTVDNDGLPPYAPILNNETCIDGKLSGIKVPCYPQPEPIAYPNVYFKGPLDQNNMEVRFPKKGMNRTWILPVSPATTTWGYFDYWGQKPALEIAPGDSVAIETQVAGGGQVVPGITIQQLSYINSAVDGRGPHTMTGPIKVLGARAPAQGQMPIDFVAVHINKIRMLSYATNNSGDSAGLFPEYPLLQHYDKTTGQGVFVIDKISQSMWPNPRPAFIDSYYLDNEKMTAKFNDHITIPLRPFPGVLAVARSNEALTQDYWQGQKSQLLNPGWCTKNIPGMEATQAWGGCDTKQPGKWGGNLDIREMTEGSTTYLPVFQDGAMIWTGDSHAAQGNGEIDLDALETAYPELNVTVDVVHVRDRPEFGEWPIIETKKNWITVGYALQLNDAFQALLTESHRFVMAKFGLNETEATDFMLKHWDCPISEVVDEVNGTYCMWPKKIRAPKTPNVLTHETPKYWVSYSTHPTDLMSAMKNAAYMLITTAAGPLGITPGEAYTLATFAMDCRIGRPSISSDFVYNPKTPYSGPYSVSCSFPKSLLD